MSHKISRKNFLKLMGAAAGGAALAACGGSSSSGPAAAIPAEVTNDGYNADLTGVRPEETVTLTVYSQLSNSNGDMTGWFAQVLEEKFNVKLTIIPDSDGVYATRMESGNLGDIVIIADTDQYKEACAKGMLLDWNEYNILEDYGPYIYAHMQPALEKNATVSGDGLVHGIGYDIAVSAEDLSGFLYNWGVRWDLYRDLGYPEVTDLDSFADMLIAMNKANPTDPNGKKTYAVSLFSDWDGVLAMFPKALASSYFGLDEFGIGFWDPETQEYVSAAAKDSPYVQALRFYNKLYQNGALDPDSETQGYDGCAEDYRNGTSFFCPFNYLGTDMYNSVERLANGTAMYPVVPAQARTICYGQNIYGGDRIWSIGQNTEYPELCMAIINWLCTPEGKLTDLYGPKDVCWYYDEEGYTCFTELGRACITDSNTQMTDGYTGTFRDGQDQMNNTTWSRDARNLDSAVGEDYNWSHWQSNLTAAASEIEQDWRDHAGANSIDEYMATTNYALCPGTMYVSTPRSDELTVTWNQVGECIKTSSWRAIFAASDAEFDAVIDEMLAQVESYGMADCEAYMQQEAALRKAAEDAAMSA